MYTYNRINLLSRLLLASSSGYFPPRMQQSSSLYRLCLCSGLYNSTILHGGIYVPKWTVSAVAGRWKRSSPMIEVDKKLCCCRGTARRTYAKLSNSWTSDERTSLKRVQAITHYNAVIVSSLRAICIFAFSRCNTSFVYSISWLTSSYVIVATK